MQGKSLGVAPEMTALRYGLTYGQTDWLRLEKDLLRVALAFSTKPKVSQTALRAWHEGRLYEPEAVRSEAES